jgi:hypothetical protein
MNSWKKRIQEYNQENDIVTSPFQSGGDIQNQNYINNKTSNIPSLNDPYFKKLTLNGIEYQLNDKHTMQILKKIIKYYENN